MRGFNSDEEIMEYIERGIEKINRVDECRLYKREQLQFSEEVFKLRNSTEWLIRLNRVLENIRYSISKSYEYAKLMLSPMEETTNSRMYSYYLEDAVYRDIVLWDIFRQFLNEYYECGYSQDEELSIYKFLKDENVKNKIGDENAKEIRNYLNSTEHKQVREKLRNQFTHSLDSTSFYLFHRKTDGGFMQADLSNIFPNHPYYNIVLIAVNLSLSFSKSKYFF
nr:Cthe_2314 family HEPN domain-containing protein [uncultured Cellulosilyticum sp.]